MFPHPSTGQVLSPSILCQSASPLTNLIENLVVGSEKTCPIPQSENTVQECFVLDMTCTCIEFLLASFPDLLLPPYSTLIETPDVRYVYQPLEALYILLITNNTSNILQDIDSLHLLAWVVSDMCRSAGSWLHARLQLSWLWWWDDWVLARSDNWTREPCGGSFSPW
ncbi:hypothetical protein C8R45DRAFT_1144530 [Mycena sanguinolenta]|nr:hypothetical protein C8R45DRAFT_1144530 [Mycena sanguinolenta]